MSENTPKKDLPEEKKPVTKRQVKRPKRSGKKAGKQKKKEAPKTGQEQEKKKVGRKPQYNPKKHLPVAIGLARAGLTKDAIAKCMGKARSTIYEWADKYPEFSDALEGGRNVAIQEVVNGLFLRAIGYEYSEEAIEYERVPVIEYIDDPENPGQQKTVTKFVEEITKRKVTKKRVAPDPGAAMDILTNWDPDNWKRRNTLDGSLGVNQDAEQHRETIKGLLTDPEIGKELTRRIREGFRSRVGSGPSK